MTAFSHVTKNQINENIRALFHRVKKVCKISMTHEEFSSLFIPAEQREAFREMSMLAEIGDYRAARFQWGATELRFTMNKLHGKFPLLIPKHMALQHDAPAELVERITTWTNNGGNASGEFGRVKALFELLNDTLTKSQLRFVWPSILNILAVNPTLSEELKALQDVKVPSKVPELPRGLLAVCRKTAATIATSSLIPADVQELEEVEGTIEVVEYQVHEEQGLPPYHGLT